MSTTMSTEAARAFLAEVGWGRVGTYNKLSDEIYVVPTFWIIQGSDIFFYTEPGKKLENLRAHPSGIAIETERKGPANRWTSVYARGKFTEMSNGVDRDKIRSALLDEFRRRASGETPAYGQIETSPYYARRTGSTIYASAVRELMADVIQQRLVYGRIALEEISGRQV